MDRGDSLRAAVLAVQRAIEAAGERERARIDAAHPKHRPSAVNLAHYLGLRSLDIRRLQLELAALGLSSLGRSEGHVRDALLRLSGWLSGEQDGPAADGLDRTKAEARLHANTRALFGPRPADRHVYIMVTAPDAAEADEPWADSILQAGADLLRINGTDAAMSMRAECVMLNKGPHLAAAVRMLADIIRKMEKHQFKKRSLYRPLALARAT